MSPETAPFTLRDPPLQGETLLLPLYERRLGARRPSPPRVTTGNGGKALLRRRALGAGTPVQAAGDRSMHDASSICM
jgi:hypothetical protein